ncbi:decaprenyl-phosphate phosphoribosyltransferase [bacterium]|nr:MAG: decaprenyl-phosphate phosphoribosyltransferase [bacterium]
MAHNSGRSPFPSGRDRPHHLMTVRDLVRLLRVKQWTKNVFVFAALIFTKGWERPETRLYALVAFAAMTSASVAMYLFNDLLDRKADQAHPVKRDRPIASGRVGTGVAITAMVLAVLYSLGIVSVASEGSRGVPLELAGVVLTYIGLQIAYNLVLKRTPIADVATIAAGFVLRVVAGAVAISAPLSGWILLCTAFLALLLGFGKRRHEFHLEGHDVRTTRPALTGYTAASLDALLVVCAACAAISYGVYSIESPTAKLHPGLVMTTPFVVYGVLRYLALAMAGEGGEPESLVLRDVQLLVCFGGFLLAAFAALSGVRLGFLL